MLHIQVGFGDDQQRRQHLGSKVVTMASEHQIWTGPILCPQYLQNLEVTRCVKMKSVFSMDVIQTTLP